MIDEEWLTLAVAAMDELITNPDNHEVIRRVRDTTPVGFRDQAKAAARESWGYAASALVTGTLKSVTRSVPSTHPVWARHALFEAVIVWTNGLGRVCLHSPTPRAPQPVYAAMWVPRLMVCARCTPLLGCRGLSVAERTCPNCRRITAGPGTDDPLYLYGIQTGALTFSFAVCAQCRYWKTDDKTR